MGTRREEARRSRAAGMEQLLGRTFAVLDGGFVRVVDYMGGDASIVQAARVSYGKGTKKVSQDRGLIRYLMRHRHTTPFEMCEIKLHIRSPMDCWRQWVRHRMACLAEGTEIHFDLPGGLSRQGNQLYKLRIEDIWQKFQATRNRTRPDKQRNPLSRRDRVQQMQLRQVNEDNLQIVHTRVVDVFSNGVKPVFRLVLADGKRIEATRDHLFLFADGWHTLGAATGLREQGGKAVWTQGEYFLYVNGQEILARDTANLTTLCSICHRKVHGRELEYVTKLEGPPVRNDWKKRSRMAWNKLTIAKLVRIERFEYAGLKPTYDLEVEGPFHNFIANGIVTHNSVNEYSTRYSEAIDALQSTAPEGWRTQSGSNRQGSGQPLSASTGADLSEREREFQRRARELYEERLRAGVAREQARKDLPLSTYTEAYWKIDLHNLLHFLELRMDDHAQLEIRTYARTIGQEIVRAWCPLTWEAFLDYRVHALTLSAPEIEVIQAVSAGDVPRAIAAARRAGLLRGPGPVEPPQGQDRVGAEQPAAWKRSRECLELEEKLGQLGLTVPWPREGDGTGGPP